MQIRRVGDVRCKVGEGPIWDAATDELMFVDLVGQVLWTYRESDERTTSIAMPQMIAAASRDALSRLIVVLADGFYLVDEDAENVTPIIKPALALGTQFNDAKVDPWGRFVAGAADQGMKNAIASIHSLQGDGSVTEIDTGFTIANGPCWSPGGATFYCADSIAKRIYAYDYDGTTGTTANRRVFAETEALGGIPDGATVDADGNVWMAMCGAGKIVCFAPAGTVVRSIDMPTAWVSSVMFGGTRLDRLYVTSLDSSVVGIPGDEGCGYLYVIDGLGATGLPEPRASVDSLAGPCA